MIALLRLPLAFATRYAWPLVLAALAALAGTAYAYKSNAEHAQRALAECTEVRSKLEARIERLDAESSARATASSKALEAEAAQRRAAQRELTALRNKPLATSCEDAIRELSDSLRGDAP